MDRKRGEVAPATSPLLPSFPLLIKLFCGFCGETTTIRLYFFAFLAMLRLDIELSVPSDWNMSEGGYCKAFSVVLCCLVFCK